MSAEETMFQEAVACYDRGDLPRAKDLLTRLLKTSQDNPRYWLWMGALVETDKERVYCLKEALRRDASCEPARRGLILMGALTPAERPQPAPVYRRNWQATLDAAQRSTGWLPASRWQLLILVAGLLLLAALVFLGINGWRLFGPATADPHAQTPLILPTLTLPATATAGATSTPGMPGPTPLWMLLPATYTPTPLYVDTPHPMVEAYRSALRAYHRSDWGGVIQYLDQAATVEPSAPDLHYYYGEAYRQQGKLDQARSAYEQALAVQPEFPPALLGLARLLMLTEDGFSAPAEDYLQRALVADPRLTEASLALAELYLRGGDAPAALEVLAQADPSLSNSPLYYYTRARAKSDTNDLSGALADARKAREVDITFLPAYRLIGEVLLLRGDTATALKELQTFLLYQPDDAQALLALARAHLANRDPKQAAELLSRVITGGQSGLEVLLQRGQLYLDLEEPEAALKDFEAALKQENGSFSAVLGKGQALIAMGYNGDAYIHLNRSQSLAVTDEQKAGLYTWRALALEGLAERDPNANAAAVRDWEALLALPAGSSPQEWLDTARQHLIRLYTPTPTLKPSITPTPTRTPVPSQTQTRPTATALTATAQP